MPSSTTVQLLLLLLSLLAAHQQVMAQGQYDKFVCTPAIQQKLYNELRLKPVDPSEMVGYTDVRTELNQILTGPIQYPSEYSGLLGSGRGVFIFGPPGTGKTLVISTLVPQLEALGWRVLKVWRHRWLS